MLLYLALRDAKPNSISILSSFISLAKKICTFFQNTAVKLHLAFVCLCVWPYLVSEAPVKPLMVLPASPTSVIPSYLLNHLFSVLQ